MQEVDELVEECQCPVRGNRFSRSFHACRMMWKLCCRSPCSRNLRHWTMDVHAKVRAPSLESFFLLVVFAVGHFVGAPSTVNLGRPASERRPVSLMPPAQQAKPKHPKQNA